MTIDMVQPLHAGYTHSSTPVTVMMDLHAPLALHSLEPEVLTPAQRELIRTECS